MHDKTEYVIHIKNLKQELNHRVIMKNVHRMIKLNQKAWLKPKTDMSTKIRQKAKNLFWERFFKAGD